MRRYWVATAFLIVLLAVGGLAYFNSSRSATNAEGSSTNLKQNTNRTTSSQSTTQSATSNSGNSGLVVVVIPKGAGIYGGPNFTPSKLNLVIGVNNTVQWINQDNLSAHSVTALSIPKGFPKFDPIIIEPGKSYTMQLTVPGTYDYYCLWHPGWLRGTITVRSAP